MSNDVRCGDPAALAGYLYGECDPAERESMAAHLAACAMCAGDLAALRATPGQLAEWTLREAQLGFRVAAEDAEAAPGRFAEAAMPVPPAARAPWQWSSLTAWAQAAAAVLLFAAGASVAALTNLEVRYGQAGLTVRTGWQQPATAPASAASAPAVGALPSLASAGDIAALESRIREEVRRIRVDEESGKGVSGTSVAGSPAATTADARVAPASSDAVMRRVREMVAASEERQQRELAFRMSQVVRDVDSQRRADIARIERTVGPMEGITTEELQAQHRMLNYLMTVSQTK